MERPLKPYERLPVAIEYQGKSYALDLSYAAVFVAADVLDDVRMDPRTRVEVALDILVKDPHPVDDGLLEAVTELLREDRPKPVGPKTMDIEQDWPYICAAFQQAYGINLYEDKTMHVMRFRALLQAMALPHKLRGPIENNGIAAYQYIVTRRFDSLRTYVSAGTVPRSTARPLRGAKAQAAGRCLYHTIR